MCAYEKRSISILLDLFYFKRSIEPRTSEDDAESMGTISLPNPDELEETSDQAEDNGSDGHPTDDPPCTFNGNAENYSISTIDTIIFIISITSTTIIPIDMLTVHLLVNSQL